MKVRWVRWMVTKLAALYANDLQAYNDAKDSFIRKHKALALA
jgi:hypothetical protein